MGAAQSDSDAPSTGELDQRLDLLENKSTKKNLNAGLVPCLTPQDSAGELHTPSWWSGRHGHPKAGYVPQLQPQLLPASSSR